jgi:excisionase family DNA binding protein
LPAIDVRPLMTPLDVSARLAVTRNTTYKLLETGELPAKRIGGQWRIDPDEFERWLARC